jgi:uroporphyrinogen decarboxylase
VSAAAPLLRTLKGEKQARPPIWIMRQAGRYLPEYRQLRERAPDFLSFCYTPDLAAEATLQPLRRFDLDAAILFSDILVIPDALGQAVRFEPGEGPLLDAVTPETVGSLDLERVAERLSPVMETIARVRNALAPEKALIGFCGAPWTVATYMIGGRGSPESSSPRIRWLAPSRSSYWPERSAQRKAASARRPIATAIGMRNKSPLMPPSRLGPVPRSARRPSCLWP